MIPLSHAIPATTAYWANNLQFFAKLAFRFVLRNRLSEEKLAVELEKTKIQMDINYREGVVVDKQIIANALKQFGSVVKSLPEADQKELVQLIIKEVSVKHFNPETDPTPKESGVFKTKIRTKWYRVNISLFASDLFPAGLQTGEISSDLNAIGSRGRTRT